MSQFASSSSLSYQGLPIEYHPATGLVCLTDLWHAQCSPASQRPLAWIRLEATQKLLKRLAQQRSANPLWSERQYPGQKPEQLIVAIPGILETTKENGDLRTYATTDLVVVYARYLDRECYEWAQANLAEETALLDQWSAQQSQADLLKRRKVFTRRAVIAAGWSIPVVSALALNQRAAAQVSTGRGNTRTNGTGTTTTGTGITGTGTTGTTTTGTGTTTTGITGTGTTTTGITGTGTTTTGITGTGTTTTGITGTGTTTTGITTGTGITGTGTTTTGITTGTGTTTTGITTGTGTTTTGITGTGTTTTGITTGTGTTTTGITTGTGTTTTGITGTGTTTTGTGTITTP